MLLPAPNASIALFCYRKFIISGTCASAAGGHKHPVDLDRRPIECVRLPQFVGGDFRGAQPRRDQEPILSVRSYSRNDNFISRRFLNSQNAKPSAKPRHEFAVYETVYRRVEGHQIVSVGALDTTLVHSISVFRLVVTTAARALVPMHNA